MVMSEMPASPAATLFDILSNSVILHQLTPYLPVTSLLALTATCHTIKSILQTSPESFRYLDLRCVKSARLLGFDGPVDRGGINWRSQRMDENLTEDDIYGGPLRGIFSKLSRRTTLTNISTLILDGLSVPADVVQELISSTRFRLRILSIREARFLNERKLQQVLRYAIRPTRPSDTPTLRGLYIFGPVDSRPFQGTSGALAGGRAATPRPSHNGILSSPGAQIGAEWNERSHATLQASLGPASSDRWYQASGRMFKSPPSKEWAETITACEGIIAFDAVLCRGPRHDLEHTPPQHYVPPAIACIALGPDGCVDCGRCPEGAATPGLSPATHLPLLAPPPLHSSTIRAAQLPHLLTTTTQPAFHARCEECLRRRWCERCLSRFWCEACYDEGLGPASSADAGNGVAGPARQYTQVRNFAHLDEEAVLALAERDAPELAATAGSDQGIKVLMGLCTELCLVGEMMSGAGSFGMWG